MICAGDFSSVVTGAVTSSGWSSATDSPLAVVSSNGTSSDAAVSSGESSSFAEVSSTASSSEGASEDYSAEDSSETISFASTFSAVVASKFSFSLSAMILPKK